jgi:hypothetical protein
MKRLMVVVVCDESIFCQRHPNRFVPAALFLHPHPSSTANEESVMLFMVSTDMLGLERLARLFPIRTGVTVPSWVVLDGHSDHVGAAGIRGAGYAVHLVCLI